MAAASTRKYKANSNDMEPRMCDYFEDWELNLSENGFELTLTGVGSEGADVKEVKKYSGTFTEDENIVTLHANHFDRKFDLVFWHKSWYQRDKHEHKTDSKFKATWKLQKEGNNLKPIDKFSSDDFNLILKLQ